MLGRGTPVVISPTTSTPWADRSSAVERTMPTMSATSAPGTRGARRLRTQDADERADAEDGRGRVDQADRLLDHADEALEVVPLTGGSPSRAGNWPIVIVTASPITKPVTTEIARNWDRNPSRATPATTRMIPTVSASAALRTMYEVGVARRQDRADDRCRQDRDRGARRHLEMARRPEDGVGGQRRERGHEAGLGRHPGKTGVGHRDRDHHAPADDPGDGVEAEVRAVVGGQPADDRDVAA